SQTRQRGLSARWNLKEHLDNARLHVDAAVRWNSLLRPRSASVTMLALPFPRMTRTWCLDWNRRMLAKLNTFALVGIDGLPLEVEVDVSAGLPKTVLVGLPEMAVKESVHRIERALANLGYERHPGRTVINLAPADLKKDAGAFDLPIALGLLVATGQILPEQLRAFATMGELALDGSIRPIKGALSMAMAAALRGVAKLLVPAANAREA